MAVLHFIKVWVKTRPGTELDIQPRRQEVGKDSELNLIAWSLFDPQDHDVTFDAVGFLEWLDPPTAGAFGEPFLSPNRKQIFMEDLNSHQNDKPGEWDYRLHATGSDGTHYVTNVAPIMVPTNPAIINR